MHAPPSPFSPRRVKQDAIDALTCFLVDPDSELHRARGSYSLAACYQRAGPTSSSLRLSIPQSLTPRRLQLPDRPNLPCVFAHTVQYLNSHARTVRPEGLRTQPVMNPISEACRAHAVVCSPTSDPRCRCRTLRRLPRRPFLRCTGIVPFLRKCLRNELI